MTRFNRINVALSSPSLASQLLQGIELTREAAFNRETDRHIWAAHYLTAMSKALVDDAVKVLERGPDRESQEARQ